MIPLISGFLGGVLGAWIFVSVRGGAGTPQVVMQMSGQGNAGNSAPAGPAKISQGAPIPLALNNCEKELREFCGDVEVGKGRLKECLKTKNLNDDCAKQVEALPTIGDSGGKK